MAGDGMKFLSALQRGVSGFDSPSEICSPLPFFITGAGTKNANPGSFLKKSLEKWHIKQLASSGKPNLTLLLHHCFHILIADVITVAFQTHIFNNEVQLSSVIV